MEIKNIASKNIPVYHLIAEYVFILIVAFCRIFINVMLYKLILIEYNENN